MKKLTSLLALLLFILGSSYGQEEWDIEETENGSITVKSRITKQKDENDETFQLVEYEVSTQAEVSYEKCIQLIKDVSMHTQFLDYTEVSERVKYISENQWVIYYYFDAPWPMPNSDGVILIEFRENAEKSNAVFVGEATPDLYEMKDVERTMLNDIRYEFTKVERGLVEIRIISKFSPTTMAPNWLANTYFPGGPTRMVNKIIALAKR